jgi:hypothetical protein
MPELEASPIRAYEVEWKMSGKMTVYGMSAAVARSDVNQLTPQRLALYSEGIETTLSEPKEKD